MLGNLPTSHLLGAPRGGACDPLGNYSQRVQALNVFVKHLFKCPLFGVCVPKTISLMALGDFNPQMLSAWTLWDLGAAVKLEERSTFVDSGPR